MAPAGARATPWLAADRRIPLRPAVMRRYLAILKVRRMPTLLAASVLARLPLSINGIAIILYLQEQSGSFATAGATAGAAALGISLGTVVQSRLVDRRGIRLILPLALTHAAALAALIAGARSTLPAGLLVVVGFAVGVTLPSISSILRAQYPELLAHDARLLASAYALDAAVTDLTFAAGPLLVALFTITVGPGWALAGSGAAVLAGAIAFLTVVTDMTSSGPSAGTAGTGSALRAPGVLTLTLSSLPVGFAFGALEVTISAFAHAVGVIGAAGALIAVYATGSVAGGLIYGSRRWPSTLTTQHHWLTFLFPAGLALLVVAWSPLAMAALLMPVALVTGPLVASRNELTGRVARPGTETEAYAWPLTALYAGTAAGAAAAGAVTEHTSWHGGVVLAAATAALGVVVVAAGRRGLEPAT